MIHTSIPIHDRLKELSVEGNRTLDGVFIDHHSIEHFAQSGLHTSGIRCSRHSKQVNIRVPLSSKNMVVRAAKTPYTEE